MTSIHRAWWLLAVTLVLAVVFGVASPIGQLANYHDFADQRGWDWLPNAADVLSNLGFALAGAAGLRLLWTRTPEQLQAAGLERAWLGYSLFFVAMLATAAGSSWYHLHPDDTRLVWDRLPIALACAGLLDGVISEHLPPRPLLLVRLALGAWVPASVLWWTATGDLSPYLLLQLLPLILIPLVLLLWPQRRQETRLWLAAIGAYIAAKLAELYDHALYAQLVLVSGHTLKHVLAALAALMIVLLLRGRLQRAGN